MTFVWIAVILLGLLAIIDLIVGVSNDAVNFLNAAIGSRAARKKLVYWMAALGLLIGSLLSANMMEVARKGVIYPSSFAFTELLVVFVAVMLVDIMLIDGFNTLGFPTSTTIAIVFELLGGALALSFIKNREARMTGLEVEQLINTDKAFIILAGILLSIFLAFIVGIIVQFITRVIFTFNYKHRYKYLFPIMGGVAITSIGFMIFKKALIDSFINNQEWFQLAQSYQSETLISIFAISTFIFLFLSLSFNADIPKMVVFFGTFALAMSFAANDLVNFIGLPLTAVEGFKNFLSSGATNPDSFSMGFLNDGIIRKNLFQDHFYTLIFTLSAVVMTITLFKSSKAKGVTETEVYLGRQTSGYERFEPSHLSRVIVRNCLHLHSSIMGILPQKVVRFFDSRYRQLEHIDDSTTVDGVIYFDTVRASVNLVVASLLISLGTYMQFPLSTTFVVFMVAMGTSLADQAWGRESAVYRVSGVLSILGGWFFTACLAFIGAFIFTTFIWYTGWIGAIGLLIITVCTLFITRRYYRRKQEEKRILKEEFQDEIESNLDHLMEAGGEQIRHNLQEASKVFYLSIQGFIDEDVRQLHEAHDKALLLDKLTRNSKSKFYYAFAKVTEEGIDSGHYFIQAFDYLTEMVGCLTNITQPLYEHIENQHKGLTGSQRKDMQELLDEVSAYFNHIIHLEKEHKFELINEMITKQNFLISFQESLRKNQIKRIQKGEGKTRVSILFMDVLAETKNVVLYSINLVKAHRDFVISYRSNS